MFDNLSSNKNPNVINATCYNKMFPMFRRMNDTF